MEQEEEPGELFWLGESSKLSSKDLQVRSV
jgi:hypothetical protein